jgi:RNA polymerase sigma-70 factor (ECF subfamily)
LKRQLKITALTKHDDDESNDYELPVGSESDPEEQLLRKQTAMKIHRILHDLKEPYKEVFQLRTFGDLSFAEIGELFGKSESWARVTYYRSRMMIKEELDEDSL